MPSSVANAAASTVMPFGLARSFRHSREYTVAENKYKNGESQRRLRTATSRKSWAIVPILTGVELATLRTFYDARKGSKEPFYFYDATETSPLFHYDSTGAATAGRYTVRFEGQWKEEIGLSRSTADLSLVELA